MLKFTPVIIHILDKPYEVFVVADVDSNGKLLNARSNIETILSAKQDILYYLAGWDYGLTN